MPYITRNYYRTGKSNYTFKLIGICVAIFFIELFLPLLQYFSFTPAYALSEPWTFVTSIFLHLDFSHLFFNMFALFMFGIYLEQRVGGKTFLIIFFLAGIVGNIGYMVTAQDPTIPAVGASGAIYGVMGTLAILYPSLVVWVFGLMPMPMILAAFFWGIMEYVGLFYPSQVASGAHIFGLAIGILFGLYLRYTQKKMREFK